jgi:hypothetical protein
MSESGGTPAGGAPAAAPASGTTDGGAAPTPATGPRRSAPGLSSDRGGMSLNQGLAALRRTSAAPAATPARDAAQPPAPEAAPVRRAAPSQPQARGNGAAVDAGQQQQQPARSAAPSAGVLDAFIASHLPGADAADQPAPQRQGAEPQPAPTNAYLQGVPLQIGSEQRHFSVPELQEAVSKAHDYTNKTRALADQARALNERTQTIDQLLPILIPEIERQLQALNGAGAEPDWIALAADPAEYARQNAAWRVHQQQREAEQGRLAQIVQANQQREAQQRAERVRIGHAELVRTLPGWGDAATRNQLVADMRAWGTKHGFPPAEMDSIVEARHITTMAKAMAFDRIMESTRTNPLQVPQVRRGGAPTPPGPAAIRNATERFEANPNVKTGVGLLMAQRRAARPNGAAR